MNSSKKMNFAEMQWALEKFKKRSSKITGGSRQLSAQLINIFNNPNNLRIDLLNGLRETRISAAHPGYTKTKQEAFDYIQKSNDFLDRWITEKK